MKYAESVFSPKISILFFVLLLTMELSSQQNSVNEYSQYLFPEFSNGSLLLKDGQEQKILLNYNTVTEKIVCMQDGKPYDLQNTVLIDTVFILGRKLIPYGKIFLEILHKGKSVLFIQNSSDLVPAGKPVGYGGTSQAATSFYLTSHELSPEYINIQVPPDYKVHPKPVYWIHIDDDMKDFSNSKQLLALFPDEKNELKTFIKKNKIKFDRKEDIIRIAGYIEGLY